MTLETRTPPIPARAGEGLADDEVIRLQDISVRFDVPHEPIASFKEYVIRYVKGRVTYRELWALKGVSLTVRRGESFGIIGRNGAGKSTLMCVMARVLRPATGRFWVRGTVAPLLNLGAGFHHDLTGRENVYLNATLLGHSRREIEEAFDGIVEFSELADFIDAPLRTYSSGMIGRLGFSVATAWMPEVLLLDEVLSVGDAGFKLKCRDRMEGFRRRGTTIVLVSHGMENIQSMCSRAIWLDHGVVKLEGAPHEVSARYLESMGIDPGQKDDGTE